ncbi:hypothetical protein [Streptomyces sp. NPDC005077]|uniref:hypothetical protein n=1 Tax=Streptomyces sp. NPDC005077 TaxID=3154292 RepID=UPI0033A78288
MSLVIKMARSWKPGAGSSARAWDEQVDGANLAGAHESHPVFAQASGSCVRNGLLVCRLLTVTIGAEAGCGIEGLVLVLR